MKVELIGYASPHYCGMFNIPLTSDQLAQVSDACAKNPK